ncbi:hypothetical protein [Poriferisphaera sp. WC338]|uniref:hypothetical protein n=1 Tax=Poriferisphaera sp. WC338 TaxID=3425129 RepID=UPI003D81624B
MNTFSKKTIALITLVVASLTFAGCSVKTPTATVKDITVTEKNSTGARILLTVELQNPNDVALPLPHAYYRVSLQDASSFEFKSVPALTLPAKGSQTLTLPAAFAIKPDQPLEGRHYNVVGSIFYHPPGEFRMILDQYHIPLPSADFSASGNINSAASAPEVE